MTYYLLGLFTIPLILLLCLAWGFVGCLLWATKWVLFRYRTVKLANIECPEFADPIEVTRAKLWKEWKSELKSTVRWGKPDNNYNTTLEDRAGNIYEFRGWRKPKMIRREGTPQKEEISPPPVPVPSLTRDVTEADGIKMFVD